MSVSVSLSVCVCVCACHSCLQEDFHRSQECACQKQSILQALGSSDDENTPFQTCNTYLHVNHEAPPTGLDPSW